MIQRFRSLVLGRLYLSSRHYSTSHQKIILTLYTKKNCTLCAEAKEAIESLYPDKFSIEEVDITKDRSLFRKFKLDIPVFYYQDKFLMQHRVDKNALESLLLENSRDLTMK